MQTPKCSGKNIYRLIPENGTSIPALKLNEPDFAIFAHMNGSDTPRLPPPRVCTGTNK